MSNNLISGFISFEFRLDDMFFNSKQEYDKFLVMDIDEQRQFLFGKIAHRLIEQEARIKFNTSSQTKQLLHS